MRDQKQVQTQNVLLVHWEASVVCASAPQNGIFKAMCKVQIKVTQYQAHDEGS